MEVPDFLAAVEKHLEKELDEAQRECVEASTAASLCLVAGPGSGKTTAITLRILRLIYVDGFDPASIIATTFTNRAADELRSRVLGWATRLQEGLKAEGRLPAHLESVDVNRIVTGTLDSLAEETLRTFRIAGSAPPVVIEQFAADAVMTQDALLTDGRYRSKSLKDLAIRLDNAPSSYGFNVAKLRGVCTSARDRVAHDRVEVARFETEEAASDKGAQRLCEVMSDYHVALERELVVDFTRLEQLLLDRLTDGSLSEFTQPLKALFVDEYQDTNFLQESIYFALLEGMEGGSITVVGDDDQSLYRFRGATVDLFHLFVDRLRDGVGIEPTQIYLNSNYRSTRTIVAFANSYVGLDPAYGPARIADKPEIASRRRTDTYVDFPVIGIFRSTDVEVASQLALLMDKIFNGNGFTIPGTDVTVRKHVNGSPGDCAILCDSPQEHRYDGARRFPGFIRDELATLNNPISVFNPRGTAFHLVPEVQILGGLTLECIDGSATLQEEVKTLPREAVDRLNEWRQAGLAYIASNPVPVGSLGPFVSNWQSRTPSGGRGWPEEIPLAELVYKLATWVPKLIADVEGLVYLEVFSRTISEATRVVPPLITSDPEFRDGRIRRLLREIFVPLVLGGIDVDEALLETLPGDHVNLLSIHQAKGLEFPMVCVDVGCDFIDNRRGPARRFPRRAGSAETMEDYFRRFSSLGVSQRDALDRSFDDLVRKFFVAFTRPQDLLVLVGLGNAQEGPLGNVKNVGAGWTRDESAGSLWSQLPGIIYI